MTDCTGNRRFYVIPVQSIDNEKLESLGEEWIKQLWLQAYDAIKDNLQSFRLTKEEREELERRNHNFAELLPYEEEISLHFDFSIKQRDTWTSVEINNLLLNGKSSSQVIGKAIAKLKIKFPNFIEIKTTNKGKLYTLPIKKSGYSNSK